MNNEIIARKQFIERIRMVAEEIGMRGDSISAESVFAAADFCEELAKTISDLEVRERIDRDFLNKHLAAYDNLRRAMIEIKFRLRELEMHEDETIVKALGMAEMNP